MTSRMPGAPAKVKVDAAQVHRTDVEATAADVEGGSVRTDAGFQAP